MADFQTKQTIETREPLIAVDAGLEPGIYRFQLVVENERGIRSAPDVVLVEVFGRGGIRPSVDRPRVP